MVVLSSTGPVEIISVQVIVANADISTISLLGFVIRNWNTSAAADPHLN